MVGPITAPTCFQAGKVVLNGLPAGNWTLTQSPGGTTAGSGVTTTVSNLAPGIYTFTVTSESGCTSGPIDVNIPTNTDVPTAPIIGIPTQPTCSFSSSGSVPISGLPAGTWTLTLLPENIITTGGVTSITYGGLTEGTHNFIVTNQAGCVSGLSADVIINAKPLPPTRPIVGTITQPTCTEPTGSVALSGLPAGNWTLTRFPGGDLVWLGTGITLSGLAPSQTYYYTVTTDPGCTSPASDNVVIGAAPPVPEAPTASVTAQPNCTVSTGTITVTAPAPAAGITYSIDGSTYTNTTGIFNLVIPGPYMVTVKNSSDCISAGTSVTVNPQPALPVVTFTGTLTTQCASATTYTLSGGSPAGGSYSGTGVTGTNFNASVAGVGTHIITYSYTDIVSGCSNSATNTIVVNALSIAPNMVATQPTCSSTQGTVTLSGWTGLATIRRWLGVVATTLGNNLASPQTFSNNQPLGGPYTYTYQVAGQCISNPSTPVTFVAATPPATFNVGSSATTYCTGGAGVNITLSGSETGVNYQLKVGGGNDGAALPGTGSPLTWNNKTAGVYTVVATNPSNLCTTTMNGSQTITTIALPTATISGTTTICSGASANISITLTGNQPWSVTYTDGVTPVTVNNISSSPYQFTVTPASSRTYTITAVSDVNCSGTFSGSAVISLFPALVPGAHNTDPLIECSGYNPDILSFTTPISGGNPPYNYQWRLNGTDITGATSATYDPAPLIPSGDYSYDCIVTDGCGSSFTTSAKLITIVPDPSVGISGNASVCQNGSVTLTANITNGTGTYLYQWRIGPSWTDIPGATNQTYNPPTSGAGTFDYQVFINPAHPECNQATSPTFTLTVNPSLPASVSIAAVPSGAICAGTSVTFTATPTNGGTTPSYQWYNGATLIPGATSSTYTSTTLANGDAINVHMTSNLACVTGSPATSNTITMAVNPVLPASVNIVAAPAGAICAGTSVTFTATPTNGGTTPSYQWYNGATLIPGATSSTYTSTTLANGDAINVHMTSNLACVTGSPATSNTITMAVNPVLPASVNIVAAPAGAICAGTSVTFTATPTNGGTTPSYQWYNGATLIPGATSSTYTSTTLANGDAINVHMTSNLACVTGSPATSNTITMAVNPVLPASVNIVAAPAGAICAGTSVTFTATPTNGGTTPSYQWYNGATLIPGATSSTYTSTTLANGDAINVHMTSNLACVTGSPATSNTITMAVNPVLPASVNIVAAPAGAICAGTSVTFTATPTNGGTTPSYQWYNGATLIPGATSSTYTSTTLANGDAINVHMTSNLACVTGSPATSNTITMAVNPVLPASVNIVAAPAGAICAGTSVTFTATPTNGGTTPSYQWYNGATLIPGATSSTYTSTTLANGDAINVHMTSNLACVTGSPATSNTITMAVNPVLPASVNIVAAPAGAICAGTSVTFTATPTNGGTTPSYQWYNGATLIPGATSSTYTSTTLANGDAINVHMTSNLACVTGSPATSNTITMAVNPVLPASVNIVAAPAGAICAGTSVTFTATPTNGGTTPSYQWYNGATLIPGATSSTYTSTTLANGDAINVHMTSNLACVTGSPATSNTITMAVNPVLPASVNIVAAPVGAICAGTSVTFTATPTNGGTTPSYQWYNGATLIPGATSSTYTSTTLANGDAINVHMTSNLACVTGSPATSNTITMAVNPVLPASVNIVAAPAGAICAGTSVTFTATPTNGGTTPSYQWYNGATLIPGATSSTYTSTTLANGDAINVHMTSNLACVTGSPATSNTITMAVNPVLPASVNIVAAPVGAICAGTSVTFTATPTNGGTTPSYQWYNGATLIPGATSSTYTSTTLANGDAINVHMTSNLACVTGSPATSNTITMAVNPVLPASVNIVAAPAGAICAGTSVTFTATPTNGGTTPSYQWYNGATLIPGATSSTYTSTTLANGDAINVHMTSNLACVTGSPATSNTITMAVNPVLPASVNIVAAPAGAICAGTSVTFTATPTNGGTTPSYQWYNGATLIPGATSSTYTSTTLANGDAINVHMTSNLACVTGSPATSNTITMAVNPVLPASVNIVAAPAGAICAGTSVTFTATPTNGGTTPSYQWYNGATLIPGATSSTYTSTTLANGDAINVHMTSNLACVTGSPATSNTITMAVNPVLPASVNIVAAPAGAICAGTSVTFTATPINGGTTPSYQWYNGATLIPGATSSTYTSTTLANGDAINVHMTSNLACVTGSPATSNTITMAVNPVLPASVNIVAAPAGAICAGTSVTFTATPTNGGTTPSYQWYNGATLIPGATSSTYTSTTLANGDAINVHMTSNLACVTGSPATSNTITMAVNPVLPASVNIVAAPAGAICAGTSVTFTATPTNGGTTPSYQWYNGATLIPGATSSTYTSTTLANGDAINVHMTSNLACVTGSPATSNTITMAVNPVLPASVNIVAAPAGAICAGTSVTFTATPTNGGTTPSYQWYNGATLIPGATSSTYTSTTLANGDAINVHMTSNLACVTGSPATSNTITMVVNPILTASVSVAAVPSGAICAGTSVTFTATPTNGGTTPAYQWRINGSNAGTDNPTFTSTTFNNGDVVTVVMTSNANCTTSPTATSAPVTMTVNASVTPGVTIAALPVGAVCAGMSVTFTATPVNGGATPSYQWRVNGVNAGTNSPSFTSTTLINGDVVTVVMTSNATCTTTPTATSAPITMTVNANVTPSVSVVASQTSICSGASVTFTATPTNGGAAPSYQWKVNGGNAGTDSPTFTSTTLTNGDVVTVVMTSNATCTTTPTATSAPVTMTVNASVTPAVTIAANPTGAICAGTSVIFTATPVNGGTVPSYQWRINGSNAGTDSPTFTSTTFNNGDVVTVVMTSNANCTTTPTATSAPITMTVNASVTPGVTIAALPIGAVCAGTSVTFTATPVNGGAAPSYQWRINGSNAGTNSPTFTSTTLTNGDVVTVVMTSNAACTTSPTATSAPVTMTVNASVTPSVSVVASQTSICVGASVTFTATPTNGGAAPSYQWKVNGGNAGTNSPTFTSTTLTNGDVVTVVMTSNATCITSPTATSAPVTMTVNASVTPVVTIAASPSGDICTGTSVTFTATPTNGGAAPTYLWQVNGITVPGQTTATFTTATLANNDQVRVTMTSNAACTTSPTATSTPITMTVNSVTPSVSIVASQTSICLGASVTFTATPTNGGTAPTYQWQVNGITAPGQTAETFTTTTLVNNDQVRVIMTSNASCTTTPTATSNTITMSAASITPAVSVAASQTSICVGASVTFTATPTNGGAAPTYEWQVNGIAVSGQTAETFTTTTLVNNDQVKVIMTSNATCTTTPTATSNTITMSAASITPAVSVAASQTSICVGASVTFTATPTNGGAAPTYEWQVNGITAPGQTTETFTTSTLANNDQVRAIMTSNATCTTTPTATSNTITISAASTTPSVSVAASQTSICAGASVTFTATPTNGGAAPTYEWQINGITVPGQTAATFTTTTLANNDQVRVTMTSNAACTTSPTATSTPVIITVNSVTPSVSVAASQTSICVGASVTFTATPTNGGAAPTYEWQVNGITVPGQTAATFITTTLVNNDQVRVIMTSNASCTTTATATSNTITMTAASITPAVSVVASQTSICSGASVTFTATPTNGGAAPSYQWKVNGGNAGTDSPTFTSTTLTNGDVITVVMTSNATCTTTPTATSAPVTMTVNASVTPAVTIAANPTGAICAGTSVIFTATPVNGGTVPSYQWRINGSNAGTDSPTFTSTTFNNGDVVTVVMTSNANCTTSPTATSAPVTMTVNAVPIVADQTASILTSTLFTVAPAGVPAGTTYTWTTPTYTGGVSGGSAQPVPQPSISQTLIVPSGTGTAIYTVTPASGACIGADFIVTITVTSGCVPVTIGTQPSDNNMCSTSGIVSFSVIANGTAPFTYQWEYNNGVTWSSVSNGTPAGASYTNETSSSMDVTGITSAGSYQYRSVITNCSGVNNVTSAVVTLTVNATPVAPIAIVTTQPSCATPTGTITVSAPAPGAGISYTVTGTNPVIPPVTNTSGVFAGLTTGIYDVTTSNAGCVSPATALTVNTQPETPNVTDQATSILTSVPFTVTPAGVPAGTTYTWTAPTFTGGVTGGSAQPVPQTIISETLSIPSGTGTAIYTVTPTSGTCTGATFACNCNRYFIMCACYYRNTTNG